LEKNFKIIQKNKPGVLPPGFVGFGMAYSSAMTQNIPLLE